MSPHPCAKVKRIAYIQRTVYSIVATTVPSRNHQENGSMTLSGQCSSTLTLWFKKAIGIIISLKSTSVASLVTIKQRIKRYWVDITKHQQFDLDLLLYDLKIHRGYLFSEGIHSTMFGNFQAKESKDIERSSLGLETDRQSQNNMFPFQKRARNIHVDNITQNSDLRAKMLIS